MTSGQHAAHFAERLRDLKSRTDRSYGSLARRLGMNTSTLHRYCAGEAVPQDFAPVERLAGFCGASSEERLELHRLWLLAVEERQGKGRKGEASGAEGDSGAEPTGGTGEVGDGVGADGGGEGEIRATDSEAGRDGGHEVEAGISAARGESGSEIRAAGGERGRDGEPDSAGAGDPSGADTLVSTSSPAPSRPWYRRRTVVLAAVACVVAATIGTLSALPDDRRAGSPGATAQAGDGVPPLSSRPGKVTGSPSTGASPSPSVSPSATGGPSAEPGPGAGASAEPSDSAAPGKKPFAGTPLTWSVDSHVWNQGCGHYYVVDRPPAQVPPPPMSQDARAWAAAESALHGKETMVKVSVQGRSDTAVVLEGLRVRMTGRGEPAPGNAYAMDQGCGGSLTPREFAVDLDKDRPIARPMPGNDAGTELPAVSFPYRVSAKDPEILLVTARTTGCDCSWYLELDWSSQGRTGTVRIDDAGRPFRTTAITDLPRYVYDTLNRNWRPYAE
ncbi:helix-turn-helix domain-containing protein [Streptomyces sp. 4F14]|uniref:helix-turn-helix domain-containing protein n=1 Tax=Streptomyces sp. 4F14 TaxID=3394380 RepID=UPI003A8AE6AF